MKILITGFLILSFLTCNKKVNSKFELSNVLEQNKKVNIYQLIFDSRNDSNDTVFSDGYSIKNKIEINADQIRKLSNLLSDSSNYLFDKSKNCVLIASYGIKISSDSLGRYTVLIGDDPCKKMVILNEDKNSELIYDLSDNNSINSFFHSLFIKKDSL